MVYFLDIVIIIKHIKNPVKFLDVFLVALDMYLVDMHSIYDNMEEFTRVCEETLKLQ